MQRIFQEIWWKTQGEREQYEKTESTGYLEMKERIFVERSDLT